MRRFILVAVLLLFAAPSRAGAPRITILSDAFAKNAALHRDWGFAALVEWDGRRILFDAGNHSGHLFSNARLLDVDLANLDFAIVSHRHGDHTNGLKRIIELNPGLTIYVPQDEHFGGVTPRAFFQQGDPSLPTHMRYFDGGVPEVEPHGTVLPPAKYVLVTGGLDIAPGIRLVANLSPGPAFAETPEISLIVGGDDVRTLIVGCSHPGIERILESADARTRRIQLLAGGLHLVTTPPAEVHRLSRALRDGWKIARVAPGHCTGEQTFSALREAFGADYVYAGVGERLNVPGPPKPTAAAGVQR
jgi:7,8-dihydropterin-6-yl-methyl-4-(beta-D-ribofuranosyl)aminobenzene 5'-phosphate synthase